MSDKRFDDRLQRIAARNVGGPQAELLAGVGETTKTSETAMGKPRASLILAFLGAGLGFYSFRVIRDQLGLESLTNLPADMLMEIAMSEPMIGSAAVALSLCAVMALFSLVRGRKAFRMMSFSWAALGGTLGTFITAAA